MSIPTHNLYDFVHQVTEKKFITMYFYPWGQKNLSNLISHDRGVEHNDFFPKVSKLMAPNVNFSPNLVRQLQPVLVCHDQEPLNFDLYQDHSDMVQNVIEHNNYHEFEIFSNLNLRHIFPHSRQKHWILLHSEINSPELEKYENTGRFRGAYWWSHAAIARDWYRYAQHDPLLNNRSLTKIFLIYNRDSTGTRKYRSDFAKKIVEQHLDAVVNFGSHHVQTTTPDVSAIYNAQDYSSSGISVILETVFENQRIHFTEKTLRPIACKHPFILAGGPGSLKVLKKYGFRTFEPWIDESYDSVTDTAARLDMIISEMSRIANLSADQLSVLLTNCQEIAEFNHRHFFSDTFLSSVIDEMVSNIHSVPLPYYGIDADIFIKLREYQQRHCPGSVVETMSPETVNFLNKIKNQN